MTATETMVCRHCEGTGRVIDPRLVGARLKARRIATEMSLREMAKNLGISAAYLSDMELGRRGWSTKWIKEFERNLKK